MTEYILAVTMFSVAILVIFLIKDLNKNLKNTHITINKHVSTTQRCIS